MKFRADEITSVIQCQIEESAPEVEAGGGGPGPGGGRRHRPRLRPLGRDERRAGRVPQNGVRGLAINLEEASVGVIILGDYQAIQEGEDGHGTGVAAERAGRRGDGRPRGQPAGRADRRPGADHHGHTPGWSRSTAPGVAGRQPVDEPLQTGVKAIDSMTPIGRGQRELIIGDRKTGKTAIALDTIINQKGQGVICVYVAVAQKEYSSPAAAPGPPCCRT